MGFESYYAQTTTATINPSPGSNFSYMICWKKEVLSLKSFLLPRYLHSCDCKGEFYLNIPTYKYMYMWLFLPVYFSKKIYINSPNVTWLMFRFCPIFDHFEDSNFRTDFRTYCEKTVTPSVSQTTLIFFLHGLGKAEHVFLKTNSLFKILSIPCFKASGLICIYRTFSVSKKKWKNSTATNLTSVFC